MVQSQNLAQIPVNELSGVDTDLAEELAKLGLSSVQDLLFHLPYDYGVTSSHSVVPHYIDGSPVNQLRFGELVAQAFKYVDTHNLRELLPEEVRNHPSLQPFLHGLFADELRNLHLPPPIANSEPKQPFEDGLSLREITKRYGERCDKRQSYVEPLVKTRRQFRKRLVFEELLANHLNLLLLRRKIQSETAVPLPANSQLQKDFLARLSFKLTNAQVGAYAEIAADMAKAVPMLRLLHSEVRAGKTVVAALAILVVVAEGKQAVVLAPTAELAEQYFSNFNEWFAPLGISLCLFTGEEVESERREHLVAIANGKMPVVIGIGARKHPSDTSRLFLNMK